MNKHFFIFFTCFATLFIGCNNTKEVRKDTMPSHNSDTIRLKTGSISNSLDISSRIKEIKIIPLNEKDGMHIGDVDKILIHNNNYVIVDKQTAKNVLVFNDKGDFKKELVSMGRGPGEVMQINDVWKNEDGGIDIYDFATKKVVKFNSNYSYEESIYTPRDLIFQNIFPLPGSETYVAYAGYNIPNPKYNDKNHQVTWLSEVLKPKAYALEYDTKLSNVLVYNSPSSFTRFKDSLRFFRYYDNSIYNVSEDGQISKRYVLDYGSKQFPQDFESSIFLPNAKLLKESDHRDVARVNSLFEGYFFFTGLWFETQKYTMFETGLQDGENFITLYDKSKKEIVGQCIAFEVSKPYYMYLPFPETVEDRRFVAVLHGNTLKLYIDDPQSPFYDLVRNNEDKNFVVEYTLK